MIITNIDLFLQYEQIQKCRQDLYIIIVVLLALHCRHSNILGKKNDLSVEFTEYGIHCS